MSPPSTLKLALKGEFFHQIARGEKVEEFRLCTPFWAARLEGRTYDKVVITWGYPSASNASRRLEFPWRGVERRMHQHPLFGPDPVEVYAIALQSEKPAP